MHHIETGRRRTGLGERLAVILSVTDRPVRGNSSVDRVAIFPVMVPEEVATATGAAAQALATGRVEAERIVSGAGTFRAAVAGIGMLSEEAPAGTTDRTPAPAAVAARPVWEAEASVAAEAVSVAVAAAGDADRTPGVRNGIHRSTE